MKTIEQTQSELALVTPVVEPMHVEDAVCIVPLPLSDAPVGSNVHADLAASDWRFLLPRLRYRSLLYLGTPPLAGVRVLAEMAEHGIIIVPAAADATRLTTAIDEHGIGNIRVLAADPKSGLPTHDHCIELLVAGAGAATSRLLQSAAWLAELDRVVTSDGVVYLETAGVLAAARLHRGARNSHTHGFSAPALFWPARRNGALRLVLPLGNDATARYCVDRLISGTSRRARQQRQIARALVRVGLLEYAVPRRLMLLERGPERTARAAPYVHDGAHDAGVAVADGQVVFFSRSDYNANKITLLASDRSGTPRVVVKMTRSPAYNGRLEQEHHVLTALQRGGYAAPGSYPEPYFLRHHYGLALIGQAALTGSAFRNVTTARADCPWAAQAIEWLTALGEASVERRVPAAAVARGLDALLTRFIELYPITDEEGAFLQGRVAALARSSSDVPLVFEHGDPTTWNIVTAERGGVALLDWEHGARHGLPLWDLLDFLESYGRWAERIRGGTAQRDGRIPAFLETTPLNQLTARAVSAYCARVGVSRELIEPLFYLCWVQRALRSAASGSAPHETAPFFQLLRLCIAGRRRPGLACILG